MHWHVFVLCNWWTQRKRDRVNNRVIMIPAPSSNLKIFDLFGANELSWSNRLDGSATNSDTYIF